ncbi:transposase [Alkalibacillus almallahensis]|nr:ISL3 family transposase [Alkalibacillus almallahensis]NIK13490.1 transposase [Alkalibacillus almallahensis]
MHHNMTLPGLESFHVTETREENGYYHIYVERPREVLPCPACQTSTQKIHDYRWQKIKHNRVFNRPTMIWYRKRRYQCHDVACRKRFDETNNLVDRYQRQSQEFNQAIGLETIHGKTFKDTAQRFGVSPTTVMRRFDTISESLLKETQHLPSIIAIDDFKGDTDGERFQTIITDPIKREPIDILKDRQKSTVYHYLKDHADTVDIVVMDMSPSYKAAVDQALNQPIIVADRFHFVRYMYWALDRVRRRVQHEFDDYDRKKCKNMRHVFMKRSSTLSAKQDWYLHHYCDKSDVLTSAYLLKEWFCDWFDNAKYLGSDALSTIKTDLYDFYDTVRASAIPEFEKAIGTLQNWQKEIMNSFGYNLHNGYIEGINNQTKVIKRQAFGFRRFDRLRRKVLLHHKYKDIQGQMA